MNLSLPLSAERICLTFNTRVTHAANFFLSKSATIGEGFGAFFLKTEAKVHSRKMSLLMMPPCQHYLSPNVGGNGVFRTPKWMFMSANGSA